MKIKICKIQAEALQKLGRELNDQELQSFLEMKIMEAAFEVIDFEYPESAEPAAPKSKGK